MRQKDVEFINALKNIAKGTMTEKDIALIKSRETASPPMSSTVTHLFHANSDADDYNELVLTTLPGTSVKCSASDIIVGDGTETPK